MEFGNIIDVPLGWETIYKYLLSHMSKWKHVPEMDGGSAMNSNSGGGSFGGGASGSFWTDFSNSDCRCFTASDLANDAAEGAAGTDGVVDFKPKKVFTVKVNGVLIWDKT